MQLRVSESTLPGAVNWGASMWDGIMVFYREHHYSLMLNWAKFLGGILLDRCLPCLENLKLSFVFVLWDYNSLV